jgi:hypothetical protein
VQIVPNSYDVMYDGHVEQEGAALRCFSDGLVPASTT